MFKVEDPTGKKYIFKCNCWLTTRNYKRQIDLSSVVGVQPGGAGGDEDISGLIGPRNGRVFPLTIAILFLLLVLITFTYFGNEICKKWRENLLMFNNNNNNTSMCVLTANLNNKCSDFN